MPSSANRFGNERKRQESWCGQDLETKSGRPGSNRRRPAWEAGRRLKTNGFRIPAIDLLARNTPDSTRFCPDWSNGNETETGPRCSCLLYKVEIPIPGSSNQLRTIRHFRSCREAFPDPGVEPKFTRILMNPN